MGKAKHNINDSDNENSDQQAVDKAPGEGRGKKEKVTPTDLKGKKVDADPSKESDKPVDNSKSED